jgi:flagellum-specific peptidoglycan hydrolase FlgJ
MKNVTLSPILRAGLLSACLFVFGATNAQSAKSLEAGEKAPDNIIHTVSNRIATLYGADEQVVESFVQAAVALERNSGVSASVVIAIAIHESSFTSPLFLKTGNPFGIKASNPWTGQTFTKWHDGEATSFRVYDSPEEAVTDFGKFVAGRTWYSDALTCSIDDYSCVLDGLKKTPTEPGYSMNPEWDEAVTRIIEKLDLYVLETAMR